MDKFGVDYLHDKRFRLDYIASKARDPETTDDELIMILADILVEAFTWQHKQEIAKKGGKVTPKVESKPKKKRRKPPETFYI